MNESDYNTQIINATLANDTDPNLFQDNFREGLMIDYRHFDSANITPRYEFGYGLSYTNFTLSSIFSVEGSSGLSQYPGLAVTEPGGNPNLFAIVATATTSVSNTGSVAGATVLQLYVGLPQNSAPTGTPLKSLHGFEKVYLQPGESRDVSFALTRRDVSYWDVNTQEWAIPAGEMTVMVGFSSRDLPVSAAMTLR